MQRRPYIRTIPALLVLSCLSSACATQRVDTDPTPVFDVPDTFTSVTPSDAMLPAPWWDDFNDPALTTLIEKALYQNLSLAQGRARIERAQALLRQARALQKPTLDLETGLAREWERIVHRETEDEESGSSGAAASTTSGDGMEGDSGSSSGGDRGGSERSFDRDSYETQYDLGLLLRWELDFWGRLKNATAAESESLQASLLDQEALRLLLSAQVAEAYYQALEQRLQLRLLNDQLTSARTYLELIELRFLQGDASSVDLLQQQGQVAEIEAELPSARAQLGLLENRLDVLLGQLPDGEPLTALTENDLPGPEAMNAMPVPATLLTRRPDLLAAQRRVVAADYDIAVAVAERLPQIVLDGSLILDGTGQETTLTALSGLSLFQPLLDWGRRKAAVDAARATLEEQLLVFSEAYLLAIEEVETTLWQENQQRQLVRALANREEILNRTLEQTRLRYSQGITDYLPVLTAQQDLQEVQRELLRQRRALVSLRVQLHRAVGGPTRTPAGEQSNETGSSQNNAEAS